MQGSYGDALKYIIIYKYYLFIKKRKRKTFLTLKVIG